MMELGHPQRAARGGGNMATRSFRGLSLVAVALTLIVVGCTGGGAGASAGASSGGAKMTINMAVNPWVGYEANAAVVDNLLKTQLGYEVVEKDLKEDVSWQGFETGEIDVIIENWGHPDLEKTYIDEKKVAVDAGPTGNIGIIGWYVPQWMVDEHPDITDYKNLNKYADLFKTSESGDKGQFLGSDPSYVQYDEALVENLDLNFKVIFSGGEAATIKAYQTATEQKKPLIGYFWDPQWLHSKIKLVRVALPKWTEGCDVDKEKVACDYPDTILNKIVSKRLADNGGPALQLIKNFTWTNEDQNLVSKYIAEDGMDPDEAAQKWIDDNPDKVDAWLP
jgi:glycine betaine/proline transport system substrate-binding protein